MSIYLPTGRRELNVKALVGGIGAFNHVKALALLRDYEPSDGPI